MAQYIHERRGDVMKREFDAGLIVGIISSAVGDPKNAVITARHDYDSVDAWIASQSGQSAMVGGAAVLVPFASIPLALFDFGLLMHKVAYVTQGIAGLRNCPIDKESGEVDLAVILALWSGAVIEDDLDHIFQAEIEKGIIDLPDRRKKTPKNEFFECPLQTTSEILVVDKAGTKLLATVGGQLLNRLAKTLFVRLAVRQSTKLLVGIIPFVGAVVCSSINYHIVRAVARCADTYYTKKRQFLDWNEKYKAIA